MKQLTLLAVFIPPVEKALYEAQVGVLMAQHSCRATEKCQVCWLALILYESTGRLHSEGGTSSAPSHYHANKQMASGAFSILNLFKTISQSLKTFWIPVYAPLFCLFDLLNINHPICVSLICISIYFEWLQVTNYICLFSHGYI